MSVLLLILIQLNHFVSLVVGLVQADFFGRWMARGWRSMSRTHALLIIVLRLNEGVVDFFGSVDDRLLSLGVLGGVEFWITTCCLDLRGDCNCHRRRLLQGDRA